MNLSRRKSLLTLAGALAGPAIVTGQAKKPKLKYVQIGTTHPHNGKITVYQGSDDWEVVGVAEPDPEKRKAASQSKVYGDLPLLTIEQALNIPGLSAVGIETDVRDLLRYAEIAIDAGFPIHLDKPAGESLAHFKRIYAKADKQNLCIQMGYMYRFNPAVQFLMDCLQKGWLGEPFEVQAVMSKVVPPAGRESIGEYPGGIMFELGCHIIDLAVGVLGKPDKVTAFPRKVVETGADSLMDNMLAIFEYPKATAAVRSTAVEVDGFARRHLTVCGTGGTCHIQPLDRPSIRLALSKPRGKFLKGYQDIPFDPPYRRYVGCVADLASIVRGEKASQWSADHDLAVQETVLRAAGLDPATEPAAAPSQ